MLTTTITFIITITVCCILHSPGGECIMNVVPGGTELEPQVKMGSWAGHTLIIIPTSSVLEFIVHKQ